MDTNYNIGWKRKWCIKGSHVMFVTLLLAVFVTSTIMAANDFPSDQCIKMKNVPQSDRYIEMDDIGGDLYIAAGARSQSPTSPSVVTMLLYLLPIVMISGLVVFVVASAASGELVLTPYEIVIWATSIVIITSIVAIVISLI